MARASKSGLKCIKSLFFFLLPQCSTFSSFFSIFFFNRLFYPVNPTHYPLAKLTNCICLRVAVINDGLLNGLIYVCSDGLVDKFRYQRFRDAGYLWLYLCLQLFDLLYTLFNELARGFTGLCQLFREVCLAHCQFLKFLDLLLRETDFLGLWNFGFRDCKHLFSVLFHYFLGI